MARAGVTYTDIIKAAEAIKTNRQEPTVDRVREHLGTGSKSTIAPLLKRWRADNADPDQINGLPNDLIEVVKSLYERVQQLADDKIEQANAEFQSITEQSSIELKETLSTNTQLESRLKALEQELNTAQENNRTMSQLLDQSRIDSSKNAFQRDEAISRVNELKSTIAELKQENKDIRDHFEHYQQRTADDRQLERDQFRSTNQQLQDQIQNLTNQLTRAENRISTQIKESTDYQTTVSDLSNHNQLLQQSLGEKGREVNLLKDNSEIVKAESFKINRLNDELQQKLNSLIGLHSVADKEIEMLKNSLKRAEAELGEIKDKMTLLTDENKIIIQEKAVLQGQFKQLQSAI